MAREIINLFVAYVFITAIVGVMTEMVTTAISKQLGGIGFGIGTLLAFIFQVPGKLR